MEEATNKQRDYGSGLIRVRLPKTHLKWFISSYQALLPKVLYYPHPSIATSWDQGFNPWAHARHFIFKTCRKVCVGVGRGVLESEISQISRAAAGQD